MKSTRSFRAFTLIELIVVIAIIAILMGLLMPAIMQAIETTRRQDAATAVRTLVVAATNYRNDYGRYPDIGTVQGTAENQYVAVGEISAGLCSDSNAGLCNTLRAIATGVNVDHSLNRRRQIYLEGIVATSARPPRGGFADGSMFPPEMRGCYLDPWGKQYCVILDADGDDALDLSPFYSDLTGPENIIRRNPVAFSLAKDGERGGRGYLGMYQKPGSSERPDDLVSWR